MLEGVVVVGLGMAFLIVVGWLLFVWGDKNL